ncbi:hypothetical protein D3C85_1798700 [compost metagenome]
MLVGCQQGSADLANLCLLLRQQLVVVLQEAVLHCVLYFGGQATFAVVTLDAYLLKWCGGRKAIQRIVVVATQYGFVKGSRH